MLIDQFLTIYEFRARYAIKVSAPAGIVFDSIRTADLSESKIARTLFYARGLPKSALHLDGLFAMGFVELGEIPNHELVIGIVGQFWRLQAALIRVPTGEFRSFRGPGFSKAVWNFTVRGLGTGQCELATETRIASYGRAASALFRIYWFVIAPFSGLIRREILNSIKAGAEAQFESRSA